MADVKQSDVKINVDPLRTPILYADAIRVTANENGFVLDIAQGLAGSDQAFIVTRVGLSVEHAKKLAAILADKVASQGSFLTSKVKIVG